MASMSLFSDRHGIIPSADVVDLDSLESLVRETESLKCVVGYKIGFLLSLRYGLSPVVRCVRKWSDLPVIYDHQKFGGDIPEIVSGSVLSTIKEAGISALIIFPHGGVETLRAAVSGCEREGLTPIVGGEMTHPGYLLNEGGYISNDAPERMYLDAGNTGVVRHFIVPGTKPQNLGRYASQLAAVVAEPSFLLPGIGKGQGGDILAAFDALQGYNSYAIVGRGIYAETDKRAAVERLWSSVVEAGLI